MPSSPVAENNTSVRIFIGVVSLLTRSARFMNCSARLRKSRSSPVAAPVTRKESAKPSISLISQTSYAKLRALRDDGLMPVRLVLPRHPDLACLGYRYTKQMRTVQTIRYVLPLREGGSLPAIVEADDLGLYVLKFRGAGQGILALIAELAAKSAVPLACAFPKWSSSKSIPPWGVTNP